MEAPAGGPDVIADVVREVGAALEPFPNVEAVLIEERPACSAAAMAGWERRHAPQLLPSDYRAFLSASDGLQLRWRVRHMNRSIPLGCMFIAGIEQLLAVPAAAFIDVTGARHAGLPTASGDVQLRAFELDASTACGRVCLLYSDHRKAQVWFQDISCSWCFIANSFTDYFRLMVLHLGLPRWQYAYTEVGLDTVSVAWFRLLAPSRLAIDTEQRAHQQAQEARVHALRRVERPVSDSSGRDPTPPPPLRGKEMEGIHRSPLSSPLRATSAGARGGLTSGKAMPNTPPPDTSSPACRRPPPDTSSPTGRHPPPDTSSPTGRRPPRLSGRRDGWS